MTAKDVLDFIGKKQNWSEEAKINLACRYIDYVHGHSTPGLTFDLWLQNQANWENSDGLDAGRSADDCPDYEETLQEEADRLTDCVP